MKNTYDRARMHRALDRILNSVARAKDDDSTFGFVLVDRETGTKIKLPARMKDSHGYFITVTGFTPPKNINTPGRIKTNYGLLDPNVVNAKVVSEFTLM